MKFSIGCDPEFFLVNKKQQPTSAIGVVGGTKQQPKPLGKRGFFVQEDNVAVEFNIPPALDQQAFVASIQYAMSQLKGIIGDREISQASALEFADKDLAHPKAQEFGCEPDYNAWTRDMNPKPCASNKNLRSAGGHVHVGTTEDVIEVVRAMDLFLGVPSIEKDANGSARRALYGNPGAFRPQSFGLEYRTLSNFWIFSKETIEWVYTQTAKALQFVNEGSSIEDKHGDLIQECIKTSNKDIYAYLAGYYPIN